MAAKQIIYSQMRKINKKIEIGDLVTLSIPEAELELWAYHENLSHGDLGLVVIKNKIKGQRQYCAVYFASNNKVVTLSSEFLKRVDRLQTRR